MADVEQRTDGYRGLLIGDRFLLGDLLGVGGTASVHEARDQARGGAPVAIKILHPKLSSDPGARQAFLRQAELSGVVDHPGIPSFHGCGVHEAGGVEQAWIAMDLVEGLSLDRLVHRYGPLAVEPAAQIVDGILAVLEVVHAAGLVHRDVTPANVLLSGVGEPEAMPKGAALGDCVRLLDFGLADAGGRTARVAASAVPAVEAGNARTSVVDTGTASGRVRRTAVLDVAGRGGLDAAARTIALNSAVVGNPDYLSPEHARGLAVDASADLYQVGAVLYFLLTGLPPFVRETAEQVLRAQMFAPPPVPSAVAESAQRMDLVVAKALAKLPGQRFGSAREFRVELAAALAEPRRPVIVVDQAVTGVPARGEELPVTSTAAVSEIGSDRRLSVAALVGGLAAVVTVWSLIGGFWSARSPSALPVTQPEVALASTASQAGSPAASSLPSPTVTNSRKSTVSATVSVPVLAGSLDRARTVLTRLGLRVGVVTRVPSPRAAGEVTSQLPAAGTRVPAGGEVDVSVASGSNTVPAVVGLTAQEAAKRVRLAGFRAVLDPDGGSPTTTVIDSTPYSDVVASVGSAVVLHLARLPEAGSEPTPTPTPTPQ